jgi:uncharacterized protein YcbK (DUF882 family)
MGDITQNFSRWEFACKCGCGLDKIDTRIVERLQVIRDIISVPIIITSGCRCPAHNEKVGGKPGSYHLANSKTGLCEATDFTVKEEDWHKLYWIGIDLLTRWSGGFHYYIKGHFTPIGSRPARLEQHFIHIDLGPQRRWLD